MHACESVLIYTKQTSEEKNIKIFCIWDINTYTDRIGCADNAKAGVGAYVYYAPNPIHIILCTITLS